MHLSRRHLENSNRLDAGSPSAQFGGGDVLLLLAVHLGLLFAADWIVLNPRYAGWLSADRSAHLGGEYRNIASAIAAGRGFADPFGTPTGPTAWMPPVMSYAIAAMFRAGAARADIAQVFLLLQVFGSLLACSTVMAIARGIGRPVLGFLICFIGLVCGFEDIYFSTSDAGPILLIVNLLLLTVFLGASGSSQGSEPAMAGVSTGAKRELAARMGWGLIGGLSALVSPVVGLVWLCLTFFSVICRLLGLRTERPAPRHIMIPLAVALGLAGIWIVRSRVEVGGWYPVKSNAGFELWQSQCLDDDGVLDRQTLAVHPYSSDGRLRWMYTDLGEDRFVRYFRALAFRSIRDEPTKYAARVFRRWVAACLVYQPLTAGGTPATVNPYHTFRAIIFPFPFLAAVYLLLAGGIRHGGAAGQLCVIYVAFLAPYIAVSYYPRYAIPLLGVKLVLVLLAWDGIARSARRPRPLKA